MHDARPALPKVMYAPVGWQKWKALVHVALLLVIIPFGAHYAGRAAAAVLAVTAVFGALQFIGLFSLMHESSHGHLAANRRLNALLGECIALVMGTSYPGYRLAHLTHHAAFRTVGDPQEALFPLVAKPLVAMRLIVASIVGAPVFLFFRAPFLAYKRIGPWAALRGPLLSIGFYTLLAFYLPAAEAYFLCVTILVALLIGSMNDIVYHQGLAFDDGLSACSSFNCDVFGQLFLSGANRHAEHHVYPGVPGPHLVVVSRLVRDNLAQHGAAYDHGFTAAFIRRLLGGPAFLPSGPVAAWDAHQGPVGGHRQ